MDIFNDKTVVGHLYNKNTDTVEKPPLGVTPVLKKKCLSCELTSNLFLKRSLNARPDRDVGFNLE